MIKNIVGFIFARGGSKGVPRKNIRLLAGKPLIAYAIETAKQSNYISRVVVSTDDQEIADVARQYFAEVPFIRPKELAGDLSPEWQAWQHAINMVETKSYEKIDICVSIPPTSPLRTVEDLDNCIKKFLNNESDMVITVSKSDRNPFFNMVTLDCNGFAKIVVPSGKTIFQRQDAPQVYDITTVAYVSSRDFILQHQSIFEGKVQTIEIPKERALDIDTEIDFAFVEFLMTHQNATTLINNTT